jgi:hypothetical protein
VLAYVYFEDEPGGERPKCSRATSPADRRQFKLPDLLGRRAPVEEQRRLYGAAVRQVTAHDDGRGDDDAAGICHDSA